MSDYLIVHKKILPVYYEKVLEARRLLENGIEKDVIAAAKRVGISRSTYYKYKDYIFSPDNGESGRKAILSMVLNHEVGILSIALNRISELGASVLTISQSMPIHNAANVVVTLDTAGMEISIDAAIERIGELHGVENVSLIAIE